MSSKNTLDLGSGSTGNPSCIGVGVTSSIDLVSSFDSLELPSMDVVEQRNVKNLPALLSMDRTGSSALESFKFD
jgi:tartrate dehydratase beta subunit/fumarate hydratase class I family protein